MNGHLSAIPTIDQPIPQEYLTHAPFLPPINKEFILQHMSEQGRQRMQELERLMFEPVATYESHDTIPVAKLRQVDIDALLQAQIIENHSGPILGVVKVRGIPEHSKQRVRVIGWPERQNDWIREQEAYHFEETFDDVVTLKNIVLKNQFASQLDIKGAYYHTKIPHDRRNNFVFQFNGQLYHWNCMLMGTVPSCEYQQRCTRALLLNNSSARNCHIDNILIANADYQQCISDWRQVIANANLANFILNPSEPPTTSVTYFGYLLDFQQKTLTLGQKFLANLQESAMQFFECKATLQTFFQLIGRLFHAAQVIELNLARFYHAIKYYRTKAALFTRGIIHLETPIAPWASAAQEMHTWLECILRRPFIALKEKASNCATLYTDASNKGWGAILFFNGQVHHVGHQWDEQWSQYHINSKELKAVSLALKHFQTILSTVHINLFVDNITAKSCLQHFYSPDFVRNTLLRNIHDLLSISNSTLTVGFVPSSENVADRYSRHFFFNADRRPWAGQDSRGLRP